MPSDLIAITLPDTTVIYANASYCRFANLSCNELTGRKLSEVLSPNDEQQFKSVANSICIEHPVNEAIFKTEYQGKTIWISWNESGMFDEAGNLTQILSVGHVLDNSAVKLSNEKEQFIASFSALQKVLDLHVIVSITDARGVITYVNNKFCEISQYTREELLGNTHKIVNSGYHPAGFFKTIWQTILSGQAWTGEIKNKARDGSTYWVKSVIIPVINSGMITNFLSLRIDITDKKNLEWQKDEYTKLIEGILYGISHEIRKPVATTIGLLKILSDEMTESNAAVNEHIDLLMTTANEIDCIIRVWNDKLAVKNKIVC